MKRKLAMLLAIGMVMSLAGCSGGKTNDAAATANEAEGGDEAAVNENAKSYTIGYSFANIDENNQRTKDAIEARMEELNATGEYNLEFIFTDAQSQVDKQIADVESLIQQSPDLILVSAVDTVGSIPCLEAVKNAGILAVDDRGCETDAFDFRWVGFNEDAIAEMKVQAMKDYLEANPDEHLYVGGIFGLASQSEQLKRVQCIIDLAEEMPERITILETQYCDWSTDRATSTTEDWLLKYPEMNCIVTASDDMGLGVCNALKSNGKSDFYVDGVDGTKIGIDLCIDGTQNYVTIGANQQEIMNQFIDVSIQAIEGEFTDNEYRCDASCFSIINRDNVAENSTVQ